jgi:type I restriction enzyme M protein
MANESSTIVQKLWNYCNVLRDDGVSYSDYVEQLTYLLFLKMADEQTTLLGKPSTIPSEYNWQSLRSQDGDALEIQYRKTLENLGKEKGLLGVIFRKSQNKIQDPAKLKRLIELTNSETWVGLDVDVKGEIYEGLLQKNAEDTKSGAGQYFTPRALIKAIVEVMRPEPGQRICDPGLRHWRLLPDCPRLHFPSLSPRQSPEAVPQVHDLQGQRRSRWSGAPVCDEPLPARHQR